MKKLLSVLVMAGLLAGIGCGGDTTTAKKDTKTGTTTTPAKDTTKDSSKPDTRKEL